MTFIKNHPLFRWHLILLISLILFTALSLGRLNQIVSADDLWILTAAQTLHAHGTPEIFNHPGAFFYHHPLLYLYLLAFFFKLFGPTAVVARILGILLTLLSIVLVFLITRALAKGSLLSKTQLAVIVSGCYALAPTTIQGALLIQIDTTLLIPALLLIIGSIIQYLQNKNLWRLGLVALSVTLALWSRLSTPLFFIAGLFLYNLWTPETPRQRILLAVALSVGTAFFLLSWLAYCHIKNISFFQAFEYSFNYVSSADRTPKLSSISTNILYLTWWLSFFTLGALVCAWSRIARKFFQEFSFLSNHLFLVSASALFFLYTFLGVTTFSFPRYYSPAIPFLFIGLGLTFQKEDFKYLNGRQIILFLILAMAIQVTIVGDWFYVWRLSLREYLMMPSVALSNVLENTLLRLTVAGLIYLIIFFVIGKMFRWKSWAGLLVLLAIGTLAGTTLLQTTAPYNTGYNYGEEGLNAVVQRLEERNITAPSALGPCELIFALGHDRSRYLPNTFWNAPKGIENTLREPSTKAFVYGTTTNTVGQIKAIQRHPGLQTLLREQFESASIGTYQVYIKK